jgi:hypothetical protein
MRRPKPVPARWVQICASVLLVHAAAAQALLRPGSPNRPVVLPAGDDAILESSEPRADLPCAVRSKPPELGFDLRFHSGYVLTLKMDQFSTSENLLTTIFRVTPIPAGSASVYFVDHVPVPPAGRERQGSAELEGFFDLGPGDYRVDWLMRDRLGRVCAAHWDMSARISSKAGRVVLHVAKGEILPSVVEVEPQIAPATVPDALMRVSVIANVGPSAYGRRGPELGDIGAVVSVLRTLASERRIGSNLKTDNDHLGHRIV